MKRVMRWIAFAYIVVAPLVLLAILAWLCVIWMSVL
jgi:hypothetical protein